MDEDDFYFEEEEDETNDNCQICSRSINFNLMLVCDECNKEVCHVKIYLIMIIRHIVILQYEHLESQKINGIV